MLLNIGHSDHHWMLTVEVNISEVIELRTATVLLTGMIKPMIKVIKFLQEGIDGRLRQVIYGVEHFN